MTADILERLLNGDLADPDGGPTLRVPTRAVVIAETLEGREAELIEQLDLGGRLALVSDANTHAALGARVARALAGRVAITEIRLPGGPTPMRATSRRCGARVRTATP